MDIKKHYILIIILAVVAGAGLFYLYVYQAPPAAAPENKLSDEAVKSLAGNEDTKPVPADDTPKPAPTVDKNKELAERAFDAFSKVNMQLAVSLKEIEAALKSGENAFLAMHAIYENKDYGAFFSYSDPYLKSAAEKSRARAEESFLQARSALMAAQGDAYKNTDISFTKTLVFLDDITAALSDTRAALAQSVLAASITQVQINDFGNSVDGARAGVLTAKYSLSETKSVLDTLKKDPAYIFYINNYNQATLGE